jgi:aminoglycoside phosphotransferase (APT) family kinase protein
VPEVHLTISGKTQANMGGLYVSVEQYIEHSGIKVHDSAPDKEYLMSLGKALSSLHEVEIPKIDSASPIPVETFQSSYLIPAQETLALFMDWCTDKPPAQDARNLLTEKAESIQALFDRSIVLGAKLKVDPPKLVLTHGDVHFGNTIETDDSHFYIVDWDLAMIGGAGHDLMYFSDAQLVDISLGYGSDLLADQDNLQYYRNHLMLRFVWFWLNKAMTAKDDESLRSVTETISTTLNDSDYMMRALGMPSVHGCKVLT